MRILVTGKKGRPLGKIARTFSPRGDLHATAVPISSQVLEIIQSQNFDAVIFVLASPEEADPVQWIRKRNPSLPIVAVLLREIPKVRKVLWLESVSSIVNVRGLTLAQIRRKLGETLRALGKKQDSSHSSAQRCTSDFHEIRSTLTAIQGNAELALQDFRSSESARKQMQEVLRGVTETEKVIRRLERKLKLIGMLSE